MTARWPAHEVEILAADARALAAARLAALPAKWSAAGCDAEAVWGLFVGAAGEPYQTAVELGTVATRCSCPSRKLPCKHAIALLLLWSAGHVPEGPGRPQFAAEWLARRAARAVNAPATAAPAREADPEPADTAAIRPRPAGRAPLDDQPPPADPARDERAAQRWERMNGGLIELDRWIGDCLRGGLTAPELAGYGAWDTVAARLVDAQLGSLANRVRRIGSLVGVGAGWHERVLGELATVSMLASAGRRLPALDADLADSVRAALGVTVRQADVLGRAPESGEWQVLGRSDVLEDRIVVRRTWMRSTGVEWRWALVLSFAAYGQSLVDGPQPGDVLYADVHRYPGRLELRSLLGEVAEAVVGSAPIPATTSLAGACDEVGAALAAVPWIERWPVCVLATPTFAAGRWALTDHTGSLTLAGSAAPVALVAASGGRPVPIMGEWTADGVVPLALHSDGRLVDVGPRGGFHERRWNRAA